MGKLVVFFIMMALSFAGGFVADLTGYFSRIQNPVAVLQASSGTVRRLGDGELTWDRAKSGAVFGSRDTISTGESGGATISFFAGGEMDLGPGAMVHLVGSPEELKLDFVQGTAKVRISKSASKAIEIVQNGEALKNKTTSAGPSARIQVDEVQDSALRKPEMPKAADLIQGAVATATPEATPRPAEENPSEEKSAHLTDAVKETEIKNPEKSLAAEAAKLKDGEILNAKVNEMPVEPELGFPGNDTVIDLAREENAKLQWAVPEKTSGTPKPAFFEVILRKVDEAGSPVGQAHTLKATTPEIKMPRLSSGRYQWTVRAVSGTGSRSPAAKSRWIEVKNTAKIGKPIVLPVEVR